MCRNPPRTDRCLDLLAVSSVGSGRESGGRVSVLVPTEWASAYCYRVVGAVAALPQEHHYGLLGWSLGTTCWTRYPTVSTLTKSRRRLQNNFSLPELQCFISDSQLTRDAALHLRLGDRRSARAWAAPFGSPAVAFFLGRRRRVSLRRGLPPTLFFPCPGALCD